MWTALLGGGASSVDAQAFDVLYGFDGSDGANPYAGLIEGSGGALYGTTIAGGAYGFGIVFRINKNGTGFLDLHDFNGNGARPFAGLLEGSDGALYGATSAGGAYDDGIVFRINEDGTGFLNLHDFNQFDTANGAQPLAGLV